MAEQKTLNSQEQLQLWNDFLRRWPVETIRDLSLGQYTSIGDKDTFCYWLEHTTNRLGTIWGANSYKFGIFKCSPNTKLPDENDTRYASDRTYAWVKRSGGSADEAFERVKGSILRIIEAASNGRFDEIDKSDTPLFPIVKWKIAFLYQSQQSPALLPIYKADMLCKLAKMPVDTPVSQLQKALMNKKPDSMNLLEYYDYLLQTRTDVFEKDKNDKQPSSSGESGGIEKPEDKNGKDSGDGKNEIGILQEPKDGNGHPLPRNLIYFGAPGTGKSYKLKENVERSENHFIDKDEDDRVRYERVTFYPTYSYAQFVGCYKPVMKTKSDGTSGEEIAYKFVPGPFLRILVKALNNPKNNYCLVIEEINRANAAAVFGDVFQLLDRSSDGVSEYDIAASEDVEKFLYEDEKGLNSEGQKELEKLAKEKGRLIIPQNMYIWATMNSADQGVFPLDTAFKRRWEFEYVGINDGWNKGNTEQPAPNKWEIADTEYYWEPVRRFINAQLSNNGVNEDKLMGPFFVKPATKNAKIVSADTFKSKVLMYLWEDAARMCRQKLFDKSIKVFSDLVHKWPKEKVFNAASDEETQKWKAGQADR